MVRRDTRRTVAELLPKNAAGAEIGVFQGEFSALLLRVAEPAVLHLIDPWLSVSDLAYQGALYGSDSRTQSDMDAICADVRGRFAAEIGQGRVIVHRKPSIEAMQEFPDASLGWVYIDGDHSYMAALNDLRAAYRAVKPGGLICLDDYKASQGWFRDGVIRAAHQFLGDVGSSVVLVFVSGDQLVLQKRRA